MEKDNKTSTTVFVYNEFKRAIIKYYNIMYFNSKYSI